MAQQSLNLGTPDSGDGDTLRSGGEKINANFDELYTSVSLKANLASPAFTGNPSAPTQAPGNNSTRLASTAFVSAELSAAVEAIVGMSPEDLNTLQEIAARMVEGESDIAAISSALAGKVPVTRTINGSALSADVTLSKTDIGLGNADNTSDAAKPLSSAAVSALAGKAALSHTHAGLVTTVRGTVNGHTDVGSAAGAPPPVVLSIGYIGDGRVVITTEAGSVGFSLTINDPMNGDVWIDSTNFMTVEEYASAIAPAIEAAVVGVSASVSGYDVTLTRSDLGASVGLYYGDNAGSVGASGGGNGIDATPPTGSVTDATLSSSAKTILSGYWACTESIVGTVQLRDVGSDTVFWTRVNPTGGTGGTVEPSNSLSQLWMISESIVLELVDLGAGPGGYMTVQLHLGPTA